MTVFQDGEATTCPDCGGDLEYQSQVTVLCTDCDTQFDHFYTTHRHELCIVADDGPTLEVVASEPRSDDRLRADGGTVPEIDVFPLGHPAIVRVTAGGGRRTHLDGLAG